MNQGTINDITNLKFYTDRGVEIAMQKQFILTWEFIPSSYASNYMKEAPSGYFIGDVDCSDSNNIKIKANTLMVGFINNGSILASFSNNSNPTEEDYYEWVKSIVINSDNSVKVSININNNQYTNTYSAITIFNMDETDSTKYKDYYKTTNIYTGDNLDDYSQEFFQYLGLTKLNLVADKTGSTTSYIQKIFETNVPNIGFYFPFIRYSGDFYQDIVSVNFIAANTIIILEKCIDENNNVTFERPYISDSNRFSIVFQPTTQSELKIISSDNDANIIYLDSISLSLSDPEPMQGTITPLSFAVGFTAEEEGAYQNFLGIYLKSNNESEKNFNFFMGLISFKTQVEGEDERFRTLLGNFGIPDPNNYSNIFAEQEFDEEGKDYTLINKKSKELMLTYDQIFPYVGTYKALINAVKFLGYSDIVFKEWYTLLDSNDDMHDVAVQVFDTSSGQMLKQKLAQYGVSIEDFTKYNKINRLTMIYHLNELDEENEEAIVGQYAAYNPTTKKIEKGDSDVFYSEIPLTKPVYEYRTDEIIAKLFSVKNWLEQHIIGVGAYISEITGEGIYLGWQKTQGYVTQHDLVDYSSQQYYTPDAKCILPFIESTGKIACTLTELNDSLQFKDYDDVTIDEFIRFDTSIEMKDTLGYQMDESTIPCSNSLEAPVLGDEYEFVLTINPNTGTLHEWMNEGSNEIYVSDGEITLLNDDEIDASISQSNLPIIQLENANIHKVYGNWRENVEWTIREITDTETGNVHYKLKNHGTYRNESYYITANNVYILKPVTSDAYIKYTEKTKWGVPMFLIHGYYFYNLDIDSDYEYLYKDLKTGEYVIEILKGDMLFKENNSVAAQLAFSNDNIMQEQQVAIQYTYSSERKPFTLVNNSSILAEANKTHSYTNEIAQITKDGSNIQKQFNNIVCDISTYITTSFQHVAYEEASTFITNDASYLADISTFNNFKKEARIKARLYDDYEKAYNDNYLCNKTIDVPVNHLGKYNILSKAYDRYNNTFANKYCKQVDMMVKPVSIDLYVTNGNSNNATDFYRINVDGSLCSSTDIQTIKNNADETPDFPRNYIIQDFDKDGSTNSIDFDNLSYAIDTPKNNDYVIFHNLSEICSSAKVINNSTKLSMLDENPHRLNFICATTADKLLKYNSYINIVIYDETKMQDISVFGPYEVVDVSIINGQNDTNLSDQSYLMINAQLSNAQLSLIGNESYKAYVLNVGEYQITRRTYEISDTWNGWHYNNFRWPYLEIEQYENDYDTNTCKIRQFYLSSVNEQLFNVDDVVKLRARYYYMSSNAVCSNINETAYRILSIEQKYHNSTYYVSSSVGYIEYTLNGLINDNYLEYTDEDGIIHNPSTSLSIMYANTYPTHYVAKVIDDAYEYNYSIDKEYSILRDKFTYNGNQLFLDDYIDDTYSGQIMKFDPNELSRIWLDVNTINSSIAELYYYHNAPITIKQGDWLILKDHDREGALKPGYHTEWQFSSYLIDDWDNIDGFINNENKQILFRSLNKYLTIKPDILGPQDIELECIDIYGNRLINSGEGKIFVKEK